MIFTKKKFIYEIFFYLLHLIFIGYYCSINLKKQSEHSGLRRDTSSLVYFKLLCLQLASVDIIQFIAVKFLNSLHIIMKTRRLSLITVVF